MWTYGSGTGATFETGSVRTDDLPGCGTGCCGSGSSPPGTSGPPDGAGSCSAGGRRGDQGTSSPPWAGWFCQEIRSSQLDLLTSPAGGGAPTRFIPEVSVHAAVGQSTVIVRPHVFVVTPGASDVAGELEHHRGGEGVRAGQDVSGCTESRRPGTDHRQPLQRHPRSDRDNC